MRRTLLLALSLPLFASTVVGQTIWNVAAGAPIQPVVDGAAPGDIVVLAPGVYEKFDLDKGLTILGPATIGSNMQTIDLTIAIPPNQNARLVGLTVMRDFPGGVFAFSRGITRVTAGVVVFENCSFNAADLSSAITVNDADVVFDHCVASSGSEFGCACGALRAENANVVATDSSFSGALGFMIQAPGRGIQAIGTGSLHLSSSSVTGGDMSSFGQAVQPAIETAVPTWLTDCVLYGGGVGVPGLIATAATETARCTIYSGTSGPVTDNPSLLGARSSAPTTVGGTLSLTYVADQAGVDVAVLVTVSDLIPPFSLTTIAQPLWSASLFWATALTTAANAEATLTVSIPALPEFQYQTYDFVGARLAGGIVQLAPVVPVTIR